MQRHWEFDDLVEHFTLLPHEYALIATIHAPHNRLGFAVLLKCFLSAGHFPQHRHAVPLVVVEHLAAQLHLSASIYLQYDWQGRTIKTHRTQLREALGFREATVQDADALTIWLCDQLLATHDPRLTALRDLAFARCRNLKLEPPTPDRLERSIRSALATYQSRFHTRILERLTPATCTRLDALLTTETPPDPDADDTVPASSQRTTLQLLKTDAGPVQVATAYAEGAKLEHLRALALPPDLFTGIPVPLLRSYAQQVQAEEPHELRRHPEPLRMTLLAAFCHVRQQQVTDTLVDLLIQMIHHVGFQAERRVEHALLQDIKRIANKTGILHALAETVVDEQTLHDLVTELRATNLVKRQRIQWMMRRSYGNHYRRMVPPLLRVLTFRAHSTAHRPLLNALDVLVQYADSAAASYTGDDDVPLDGVMPPRWREMVVASRQREPDRIRWVPYEICVLQALREKLRCKEIWVEGAQRYRNPEEDLPQDFADQRATYYAVLKLPLDATTFISNVQQAHADALQMLNDGLPTNPHVRITEKQGGWIERAPLTTQPEPQHLGLLKTELLQHWGMTSLLDMLHEADARIGFTDSFTSLTSREHLDRPTLRKRLLLCLYGLGTNTGLKRMTVGNADVSDKDLLYVRRRFITADHLRAAIAQIVNATLAVRLTSIWGTTTTACASDGKKFGAWEQNLRTWWHPRKPGAGVVVYWHVEQKASCVYSHLQTCTASEVIAMIQGVLRHCTDMSIEQHYVDSHGQSAVAFGLCHLLQIDLLPRLRPIHSQKLYLPDSSQADRYPHLKAVLTRPINWALIQQQYDDLVKYASAVQSGVADAEAILRRFTRNGGHATYKAMAELGRVIKTIFLCRYLHPLELRREIHEGLNVIEN